MTNRKGTKGQKQLSTKHTQKTKDRVTRTPLKTGDEHKTKDRVTRTPLKTYTEN